MSLEFAKSPQGLADAKAESLLEGSGLRMAGGGSGSGSNGGSGVPAGIVTSAGVAMAAPMEDLSTAEQSSRFVIGLSAKLRAIRDLRAACAALIASLSPETQHSGVFAVCVCVYVCMCVYVRAFFLWHKDMVIPVLLVHAHPISPPLFRCRKRRGIGRG